MNVLLAVHYVEGQEHALPHVSRELRRAGVRCRLVHDVTPRWKHRAWTLGQPTVVVSLRPLERFLPRWATVWQQVWLDKVQEYTRLEQAGVPVPRWKAVRQSELPDLSDFGQFVVVKPSAGAKGALVRIMRKEKVQWRPLFVESLGRTSETLIAQEYIHSGPWPTTWRVATVFGEPVWCWRVEANRSHPPLDYNPQHPEEFAGKSIVSTGHGCTYQPETPRDVLELARQVYRAFPTIPLLGIDIIREAATGKLYVLEVNASGGTFRLSPEDAKSLGIDVFGQFGGVRAMARGIYRRLMAEARN